MATTHFTNRAARENYLDELWADDHEALETGVLLNTDGPEYVSHEAENLLSMFDF